MVRSDKRNICFVRLKAKDFCIIKEAIVTGVLCLFSATNFIKALGLNTIIMNQIGEEGGSIHSLR